MEDIYRSQFRLPYPLYEQLKASADANHRSVNAELVARLESTFTQDPDAELTAELRKEDLSGELHMHDKNGEMRVITGEQLHAALDKVLESILGHQGGPAQQTKGPRSRKKYPRQ